MFTRPAYGLLMIAGLIASAIIWRRATRIQRIPLMVFVGGLIGAIAGAKLAYFLAELPFRWSEPHLLENVLLGRTLLGGLLGGYLGVEWGKRVCGYAQPTGDSFAVAVPIGVALGRIGCYLHGCCQGHVCGAAWYATQDASGAFRFPVALTEAGFHLLAAATLAILASTGRFRGQLFHIYLIAYGLFRFATEFLRETPRIDDRITTYQILAMGIVLFAGWRYWKRRPSRILPAGGATGGPPVRQR